MIARYRCGNEFRASEFWREKEERNCSICEEEKEDVASAKGL